MDYDEPVLYYLMNFNDFGSSMVTLFHIMVVNNWFVTVNMYCSIFDSSWPIVYFATFWVFSVLIVMNVLTASIIEVFQATDELVDIDKGKIKNTLVIKK